MKRTHTAGEYLHVQRTLVEPVRVERQEQFEERRQIAAPGGAAYETVVFAYKVTRRDTLRAVQRRISADKARKHRRPGDSIEETAREMVRREAIHLLTEDALVHPLAEAR